MRDFVREFPQAHRDNANKYDVKKTALELSFITDNKVPIRRIMNVCSHMSAARVEEMLNILEDEGYLEMDDDFVYILVDDE